MDFLLAGRSALITGATRGIGREVAWALAREGARVAIGYHEDVSAAKELASELGADENNACVVRYAIEDQDSGEAAVSYLEELWGGVDVVVNSAVQRGRRRGPGSRFEDVEPDEWAPLLANDLTATVRLCQAAVRSMRPRGWGRIVLISSHVVQNGQAGQEFYATSKSALHGLARNLAYAVGRDGILVNVVAPGLTATEGVLTALPEPVREQEIGRTATGRLSTPDEVAAMVTFLCSAINGSVTGSVVTVAGGR